MFHIWGGNQICVGDDDDGGECTCKHILMHKSL
jgi:hypothetical protein